MHVVKPHRLRRKETLKGLVDYDFVAIVAYISLRESRSQCVVCVE